MKKLLVVVFVLSNVLFNYTQKEVVPTCGTNFLHLKQLNEKQNYQLFCV